MFKRILVPVDGSAPSDSAIDLAVLLAAEHNARIAFVHAYELTRIAAMASGAGMAVIDPSPAIEAARVGGLTVLHDAVKRFGWSSSGRASSFLEEGACVESILNVARHWRADLIVIGSHGRGGIARALIGSVAEGVMRRAKVPVLVVHAAAQQPRRSAKIDHDTAVAV